MERELLYTKENQKGDKVMVDLPPDNAAYSILSYNVAIFCDWGFNDYELLSEKLSFYLQNKLQGNKITIVTRWGEIRTLITKFAKEHTNIEVECETHIRVCDSTDAYIVFWNGENKETKEFIDKVSKAGKVLKIVQYEKADSIIQNIESQTKNKYFLGVSLIGWLGLILIFILALGLVFYLNDVYSTIQSKPEVVVENETGLSATTIASIKKDIEETNKILPLKVMSDMEMLEMSFSNGVLTMKSRMLDEISDEDKEMRKTQEYNDYIKEMMIEVMIRDKDKTYHRVKEGMIFVNQYYTKDMELLYQTVITNKDLMNYE